MKSKKQTKRRFPFLGGYRSSSWHDLLFLPYIICFFLTSVLITFSTSAQHRLLLRGPDKDSFLIKSQTALLFSDFNACRLSLQQARLTLLEAGYLECSIDSLQVDDTLTQAHVVVGPKYQWAKLRNGNLPPAMLEQAKLEPSSFFHQVIHMKRLHFYYERILTQLENNGYPFANLFLDSIENNRGELAASLMLDTGPLIKLDSILLNNDAPVSKNYFMHYSGLNEGILYNEQKLKSLSVRLRELSFLQEVTPWRIQFNISKTKLRVHLQPKSANRADILVGLLPNNAELEGKFLLTGDVKLAMVNALNHGESLYLNWQNLQYKSPRYNIKLQYPYLLNSPFGLSAKFDFYKKDTTFRTINGELGLLYQFNATDYLKVYYELVGSRLGVVNVSTLKATRQLPAQADVSYRTFGMEWLYQKLDYSINPKKGYRVNIDFGTSFRKMIRNTTVEQTYDDVSQRYFSYLYDSISLRNQKYHIKGSFQYYLPLQRRLILASMFNGGYTFSNSELFKNEMFQIGGYRLLRGFDEGSLFVNSYQVFTVEPRLILSANSYFFLFSDIARITSTYYKTQWTDYPHSIGVGMSFETKAGQFNMSYAVGGRNQIPMQLRNSKIHFGYVSLF